MDDKEIKHISKFLSYVLRHRPEKIDIVLDNEGWTDLSILITNANNKGNNLTLEKIEHVVRTNDKQRFAIKGNSIRANQGHSVNVNIKFEQRIPPTRLYHGTIDKFLKDIMKHGLNSMNRTHVHLSDKLEVAAKVGSRRGAPVVLIIRADLMVKDQYKFYISENGVWLIEHVPPKYIEKLTKTI